MKQLRFGLALLLLSTASAAQEQRILFVGNSLTSYHDMPQMVQYMIDEQHLNIAVDQATQDGTMLVGHARFSIGPTGSRRVKPGEVPTTVQKILSRKWTAVILQEAPMYILIPERIRYSTRPALLYLDSVIKIQSAKTVLYQNFTYQVFPMKYCEPTGLHHFTFAVQAFNREQEFDIADAICTDSFVNSTQQLNVLQERYKELGEMIHADVVPVGTIFEACKRKYPKIRLYSGAVDYHPSKAGAYLIACVFFKYVAKGDVLHLQYRADIDEEVAKQIREVVAGSK